MVPSPLHHHAGAMTETPPEPPGSTTTRAEAGDDHPGDQPPGTGARPGVDTEHLRDYRSLRRDVDDRKIAGVCGGLARHLDIDPTLVRVVMVVLAIFGGAGLVLYAALWLFVPEQHTGSALIPVGEAARNAVVVVALVLAFLVALPAGLDGDGGVAVPLLVLAVILVAVLMSRDSATRSAQPRSSGPTAEGGTDHVASAATGDRGGHHTVAPAAPATPAAPSSRRAAARRGPVLVGFALASVALALGVLGLVDATGTSVPDAGYPALALAVVGAWLVVGSVLGRPGGLVLLGVLALLALGATSLVEPRFEGERELVVRPTSADRLDPSYDIPAGRAEIDLRGIRDLEALDGRTLDVDVNAGEIVLIVPEDLAVDLEAQVAGGGEISTPDVNRGGWGVDVDDTVRGDESRATIQADLQLGFGSIHVRSE